MNEFSDRMTIQRHFIQLINSKHRLEEELTGLSKKAIDRWVSSNRLNASSAVVALCYTAGERLNYLANHSEDQITESYSEVKSEMKAIFKKMKKLLAEQ